MYRANNTLVYVQCNTYCGSYHRDDVRVNAYYSGQYVLGSLCNTYCLLGMLLDRGVQWILTVTTLLSSVSSIRIVILDVLFWTIRVELPSLNYCSLGWQLLLWKAGYASSIDGSNFADFSAETSAGPYIMPYKAHFRSDYHTKRSNTTPNSMSSH